MDNPGFEPDPEPPLGGCKLSQSPLLPSSKSSFVTSLSSPKSHNMVVANSSASPVATTNSNVMELERLLAAKLNHGFTRCPEYEEPRYVASPVRQQPLRDMSWGCTPPQQPPSETPILAALVHQANLVNGRQDNRLNERRMTNPQTPLHPATLTRRGPNSYKLRLARRADRIVADETRAVTWAFCCSLITTALCLLITTLVLSRVPNEKASLLVNETLTSSASASIASSSTTDNLVTTPASPLWSSWSSWSHCNATRTNSWRTRTRHCLNGTRIVLDRRCPGERAEREPCRFGVDTTLEGSSRGCHECVGSEVCVALALEGPPICRPASDPQDPTGCAGHCRHGSEICQRLDHNAFRCLEVSKCLPGEFQCHNQLCVPKEKRCDGHFNCYDRSDEHLCECDLKTSFRCGAGTSCLPLSKQCDGVVNCWDASDEINCTVKACPVSGEFRCVVGACVPRARFCDGLQDCADGSDEPWGCAGRCRRYEFRCDNGRCVQRGLRCDGRDACGDGSDERGCRLLPVKAPLVPTIRLRYDVAGGEDPGIPGSPIQLISLDKQQQDSSRRAQVLLDRLLQQKSIQKRTNN